MREIILSPVTQTVEGMLFLPMPTYSIRNNCQTGLWMKSDGETIIGNELEFCLVHCQMMYGDLGKTKSAYWVQVWAISEQIMNGKVIFCTYLKGRSLNLLGNAVLEASMDNQDLVNILFRSKFIRQNNEYGSHYIIGFESSVMAKDDPRHQAITRFLETNPVFIDTNIPPTLFPVNGMDGEECKQLLRSIREEQKL
jgi:hypothetical protein